MYLCFKNFLGKKLTCVSESESTSELSICLTADLMCVWEGGDMKPDWGKIQ